MLSRHPHNSLVCCDVMTMQSFITRIFTGIPLIKPTRVNQSSARGRYLWSTLEYSRTLLRCSHTRMSRRDIRRVAVKAVNTFFAYQIAIFNHPHKSIWFCLKRKNSALKFVKAIFNSSYFLWSAVWGCCRTFISRFFVNIFLDIPLCQTALSLTSTTLYRI